MDAVTNPLACAPPADGCRCSESPAALRARMGEAGRARALALYDEGRVVARTMDLLGL